MKIKHKILLFLFILFIINIILNYLIIIYIYNKLNNNYYDDVNKNLKHCVDVISREMNFINIPVDDLTSLEINEEINNKQIQNIQSNFQDLIKKFKIDIIGFYNNNNKLVYGKSDDSNNNKNLDLLLIPSKYKKIKENLYKRNDFYSVKNGFLMTDNGLMFISLKTILRAKSEQMIGTLVLGRFVDENLIKKINSQKSLTFNILPIQDKSLNDFEKNIINSIKTKQPLLQKESENSFYIYSLINDIYDTPSLLIRTHIPKPVEVGKISLIALCCILLQSMILFLAVNLLINKTLILPIATLANLIKSFSLRAKLDQKNKVFSKLRSITPNNEIGILANEFAVSLEMTWNKDQQIKKIGEDLEERVQIRTIELLNVNQKLQQEIEERNKAEQAVEHEKRNLALILDSNPIPTFVIDKNHRVIIWNRACEELTGVIKEIVIDKPLNPKIFYQNGDIPVLADLVLEMDDHSLAKYYGNKNLFRNFTIEESFEASDHLSFLGKKPANIYFLAARLRDDKKEVIGAIETLQDITEKELLQKQLQHSQKMEAVGTLTAGMAHEFNNILAAMQGYVQLIKLKGENIGTLGDYIDDIDANCKRAAGLTRKMLTFTRTNVDERQLTKINQLIDGMHSLIRQTITSEIELEIDLQKHLPFIKADANQIEQVLLNFVVNARDAMPSAGRISIRTRLSEMDEAACRAHSLAKAGNYILIEVVDTGTGISPDILEHIFEPFFTTKEPGKGTGLGLSVAYSIIKNHGGSIAVESKVNQGSCFRIYLPAEDVTLEQNAAEEEQIKEIFPSRGESVLVVDDESQLREILQEMLSSYGYHVTEATNGQEAIEIYEKMMRQGECFDLVILDLSMPVMDGKTCTKHLLQIDPNARILITTGHAGDPELLRTNAHGILQKPFNMTALLQEVKKILDQKTNFMKTSQECMIQ